MALEWPRHFRCNPQQPARQALAPQQEQTHGWNHTPSPQAWTRCQPTTGHPPRAPKKSKPSLLWYFPFVPRSRCIASNTTAVARCERRRDCQPFGALQNSLHCRQAANHVEQSALRHYATRDKSTCTRRNPRPGPLPCSERKVRPESGLAATK